MGLTFIRVLVYSNNKLCSIMQNHAGGFFGVVCWWIRKKQINKASFFIKTAFIYRSQELKCVKSDSWQHCICSTGIVRLSQYYKNKELRLTHLMSTFYHTCTFKLVKRYFQNLTSASNKPLKCHTGVYIYWHSVISIPNIISFTLEITSSVADWPFSPLLTFSWKALERDGRRGKDMGRR